MSEKFLRKCPVCKEQMEYTNIKNRNLAEKKLKKCRKCLKEINKEKNRNKMTSLYLNFDDDKNKLIIDIFEIHGSNWKEFSRKANKQVQEFKKQIKIKCNFRKCPSCFKKLTYSNEQDAKNAEKKGSLCGSCAKSGSKNNFFGKKHSKETLNKIKETKETSESWKNFINQKRTKENREKISILMSGKNNGRFGKGSLYDIWLEKYGEEEAKRRDLEWRSKLSNHFSGENNPMYGKPSPNGSGNGWSGWYKNWFFRSLRELSFMINYIEKNNFAWENGEQKKYRISYVDWQGKNRNYFPDFVIENKTMVECKPKRLQKSINVIKKSQAAEEFCKNHNLEFLMIEPEILKLEEIKKLHNLRKIKFTEKYEKKFLELINF